MEQPITELPSATQARCEQLLTFNRTAVSYPENRLVHELFEEQVRHTPNAIAATCGDRSLTYAELNGRANQLARHLVRRGIGPDLLTGLFIERSIEMLIAVIGTLKAGGAYVPLDSSYPMDRLVYMLKDASPKVVLTQESLRERLPSTTADVIELDTEWSVISQQPVSNIDAASICGLCPNNLAYVIYTSGSTGQPKGVAIEHRNTVNFIYWGRSTMEHDAFSSTLQSTSLNFDLAAYECFVPLCTGGCVLIVENALAIVKNVVNVTLINTVPSAIKAILDAGTIPERTRVVNLAGEPLRKEVVDRIFSCSAVERVCNLYGPSETTTYSSWIVMTPEIGFINSIGRPISNTQIHVLDDRRHTVPIGMIGEIFIGGAGVARGYLNRPGLTAERFIPDPFAASSNARLYKTGDLGRWRSDGTLEYAGRNDHQVKIRGYRIELDEVEARLTQYGEVRDAVVVAHEDTAGDKRLVAYITPRHVSGPNCESLREYLKDRLPEYMVPSAFVVLESLPLTLNGKVDRRALPSPEFVASQNGRYIPPDGMIQEALVGIWRELLKVENVGGADHFFELGGDSLAVMRLVGKVREQLGAQIHVHVVFGHPVLADLASIIEGLPKVSRSSS